MFSFPLTDYISTLESIPFNYKQLLYLTKVSLTAAAARGPGFHKHMGEHKKNNTDNTGHCKELLKDALSPCIYYICIGKLSTVKR